MSKYQILINQGWFDTGILVPHSHIVILGKGRKRLFLETKMNTVLHSYSV